jgi:hypothetical protein
METKSIDRTPEVSGTDQVLQRPPLTDAAARALAEAEQRRREMAERDTPRPAEIGGRDGPDPVRYGDWETGGIASDF